MYVTVGQTTASFESERWDENDARVAVGTGTALESCQHLRESVEGANSDCGVSEDIPFKQNQANSNADVEGEREKVVENVPRCETSGEVALALGAWLVIGQSFGA